VGTAHGRVGVRNQAVVRIWNWTGGAGGAAAGGCPLIELQASPAVTTANQLGLQGQPLQGLK